MGDYYLIYPLRKYFTRMILFPQQKQIFKKKKAFLTNKKSIANNRERFEQSSIGLQRTGVPFSEFSNYYYYNFIYHRIIKTIKNVYKYNSQDNKLELSVVSFFFNLIWNGVPNMRI